MVTLTKPTGFLSLVPSVPSPSIKAPDQGSHVDVPYDLQHHVHLRGNEEPNHLAVISRTERADFWAPSCLLGNLFFEKPMVFIVSILCHDHASAGRSTSPHIAMTQKWPNWTQKMCISMQLLHCSCMVLLNHPSVWGVTLG